MKRLLLAALLLASPTAYAETNIRVGWCARTVSSAAAPFAIATKMGWFAKAGLKVDLAPLPGSTDCTKLVATGELQYALPSIEPLVVLRAQGVKVKNFYTAYQGNIYGIAVPEGSAIKSLADLKGKRIGVTAMASAGVPVARALAAAQGFNPESDIRIVAVGEGGQAAALVRQGAVDALSQYDTAYALIEAAGAKLRMLDTSAIAKFPSNGLIAREDRLANNRAEAIGGHLLVEAHLQHLEDQMPVIGQGQMHGCGGLRLDGGGEQAADKARDQGEANNTGLQRRRSLTEPGRDQTDFPAHLWHSLVAAVIPRRRQP